MSFRRQRDEWSAFIKKFGPELRVCGVPDYVFAKKIRFFIFLDHGYDEEGWLKNNYDFFDSNTLTDAQISRLVVS